MWLSSGTRAQRTLPARCLYIELSSASPAVLVGPACAECVLMAARLRQPEPDIVDVGMLAKALPQPRQIVDATAPARQALDQEASAGDVAKTLHLAAVEPGADIARRNQAFLLL